MNKLVAPIATGQIMYYTSPAIGALFIAGWNLVSMFVEFLLLKKVYHLCPALALEKSDQEGILIIVQTRSQYLIVFDSFNRKEPFLKTCIRLSSVSQKLHA